MAIYPETDEVFVGEINVDHVKWLCLIRRRAGLNSALPIDNRGLRLSSICAGGLVASSVRPGETWAVVSVDFV